MGFGWSWRVFWVIFPLKEEAKEQESRSVCLEFALAVTPPKWFVCKNRREEWVLEEAHGSTCTPFAFQHLPMIPCALGNKTPKPHYKCNHMTPNYVPLSFSCLSFPSLHKTWQTISTISHTPFPIFKYPSPFLTKKKKKNPRPIIKSAWFSLITMISGERWVLEESGDDELSTKKRGG